jgi:hypothetical protein
MSTQLSKEDWTLELEVLFIQNANTSKSCAKDLAESIAEDSYPEYTPKEAYESEISYWD